MQYHLTRAVFVFCGLPAPAPRTRFHWCMAFFSTLLVFLANPWDAGSKLDEN